MVGFIDCTAQSLGESGYRALSTPGSGVSVIVTALFTIAVAMIGYRMLLGHRPELDEVVAVVAKIGFVVALTTGWPAYRTLFYDAALRTPAALAGAIGLPLDLPVGTDALPARLQALDTALARLERVDPGGAMAMPAPPGAEGAAASAGGMRTSLIGTDQASMLQKVRMIVLVTSLGSLAATRLFAGAMLAAGPLFVACLVLAGTRGLFIGWLRVLGGATLGGFGATLMLGVALSGLEPMVAALSQRADDVPIDPDGLLRLMGVALVFAVVMLVTLIGTARVMAGLRWPRRASVATPPPAVTASDRTGPPAILDPMPRVVSDDRSRASITADAVAAQQRRERNGTTGPAIGRATVTPARPEAFDDGGVDTAVGLSFRRPMRGRVSAGMTRRNAS